MIFFIFGSGGNNASSSEDNDIAIVFWEDGLSTFDLSNSGPIIIGTDRMKNAVEAHLGDLESPSDLSNNLWRVLYRYLCQPTYVYAMVFSSGSIGILSGNDGYLLNAGGFSNNPSCPY